MIRKLIWTATVIVFAIIVFATPASIDLRPETGAVSPERFAAFALLGMLAGLLYPRRLGRVTASVVAIAIILEALQLIAPTRHGQVPDAIVKSIGAISGVGLAAALNLFIRALRSN
jgi:peptidoglycan/LPS O-acetylase OafA/YrhL